METTNASDNVSDSMLGVIAPQQSNAGDVSQQPSVSPGRAALRRFFRDKRAVVCLAIILFIVIGSFVFPPIYQHIGPVNPASIGAGKGIGPTDYHEPAFENLNYSDGPSTLLPLGPRSLVYPLGTDTNGRDLFARVMAGVNTSIIIALTVEIFDIGMGVLLGTLAGFFGGWLDTVLARFTDIMFAFPGLLLIILIAASLGPVFDSRFGSGVGRVLLIIFAIGLLVWPLMMRFVRGQTIQLKEQQYIEAARTVGGTNSTIIMRHIIPNLASIVIIAATLDILGTITTEAGISLLGVGIQPPATSLGLMISDTIASVYSNWTEPLWPAAMLIILVIAFAFIGDGIRDAFDPRTKD
jgi:ABC-type dipeptide/oligopeptide/nickel transport system permease subunit